MNVGGPGLDRGMNSTVAALGEVAADLAAVIDRVVRSDALTRLDDAVLGEVLRAGGEAMRLIEALLVESAAEVEARSAGLREERFTTRQGCRNTNELLQRAVGVDAREAARLVRASRAVRRQVDICTGAPLPARWPQLRAALLDGVIGVDGLLAATGPVEQAGPRIGDADRLRADAELAAHARGDDQGVSGPGATAEDLSILSRVIVTYLDPDGPSPPESGRCGAARSRSDPAATG